ncbi:T9SS C-terminal target domain-containing protein [bacterium]|nr:MAG: T9SS C-terminal target domain-containing protein [bacterium]
MIRASLFLSLAVAFIASAQDWQWERYEGTFWHEADPVPTFELWEVWEYVPMVIADFNGDGRDEQMLLSGYGYLRSDGVWDYASYGDGIDFYEEQEPDGLADLDLTGDNSSELIIYSYDTNTGQRIVESYELTEIDSSTGEWLQWTHCDSLLDSLDYPGLPYYSVFGDFNGNGLLNGATFHDNLITVYERNGLGEWQILWTDDLIVWDPLLFSVLDLDSDGDDEIGHVYPGIDCLCYFDNYYETTESGFEIHHGAYDGQPVVMWGGDFDGDGFDEGIVHNENDEFLFMADLVPGEELYEVVMPCLYPSNSLFVGRDLGNGGHRIWSYHNQLAFEIGPMSFSRGSRYLTWNDTCWTASAASSWGGHTLDGNMSDIDGDQMPDILLHKMYGVPGSAYDVESWMLQYSAGGYVSTSRFTGNEDTTFVNLRIGDVEGDGAGELAVRISEGAPAGLYFYEIEEVYPGWRFNLQPHLSDGLPTNITEFTLGDIDNDSQAELIAKVGGGWRAYFRRNGHWVFYPNILPNGIGEGVNFIDFDNDGDLDLVSQNGVWISLSPTPVVDNSISLPASFSLSSYPNPFNPVTTIRFSLPDAGRVSLDIFNINGQKVESLVNQQYTAGTYNVEFHGASLPSGVYFARLQASADLKTIKLLLMK